jgi:hypothetical protein
VSLFSFTNIPWTPVITTLIHHQSWLLFFKARKSPDNSDVLGSKEEARCRQQLCDYCTSANHPHCSHLSSKWNMWYLPSTGFDWILTLSLEVVSTKWTNKHPLDMTAPAPCKPLLVCGSGIYFGSFAHPLYRELKHLFNRCDSRANSTHSARAKGGLQTEGSDTLSHSRLNTQTPHKMDAIWSITNSFVFCCEESTFPSRSDYFSKAGLLGPPTLCKPSAWDAIPGWWQWKRQNKLVLGHP